MPELPEVQRVVETLLPHVVGRRVRSLRLGRADIVTPSGCDLATLVAGRAVVALRRRAKRIVFALDDGSHFFIHLGMTGQLTLVPRDAPIRPHTHAVFDFDEVDAQMRFVDPRRFGGVTWLGSGRFDVGLGPEPLTMRPVTLAKRLASTRRAVKVALLDQRLVAGIGNIYADEALHAAGIHPTTPSHALTAEQVRRLSASIKRTLHRAIRAGGSSISDYVDATGTRGTFQTRHRVYDRAGKPCTTCKTPISRILLGQRSTHFCPTCQVVGRSADV